MRISMFVLTLLFALQLTAQDNSSNQRSEALLEEAVNKDHCVGIAATYSIKGETIWESATGLANTENGTPYQLNTRNRIASICKPMTAVAIMQLVENGKLVLDDKVVEYLPKFPVTNITIRHVLNHSSGIGAYKNGKERENYTNYKSFQDAIDIFIERDLLFEPGTAFGYSSYAYNVLGLIIEKVTELSFESYMQENIWKPAGMLDTGIDRFGEKGMEKSKLYHKNSKGKIKSAKETNLSDRIPAGGCYSTTPDILKFGNAVLNGTLISIESVLLMQENLGLKKEGNGYGLGWYLYGDNNKLGVIFGHNGAQLGTSSWLLLIPEKEAVVVVISNTSGALNETFAIAMGLFKEINLAVNK